METDLVVPGPHYFVRVEPDVRESIDGVYSVGHDLIPSVLQAGVIGDLAVVAVGVVDVTDLLLFPDAVRNADDVVDYVHVGVFEAPHALLSFGAGVYQQPFRTAFG